MKVIFLNRYFYPDHSATSQMLSDLAFFLAGAGYEVCVIASARRYEEAGDVLEAQERISGVEVHRVRATRFGRGTVFGQVLGYASFYLAAGWRLWRIARAGDVIVAKTDPPLISVVAAFVARRRRARLVNWIQDVFPEVAVAVGVRALAQPQLMLLRWLRDAALRSAAANVVLGDRMADVIRRAERPGSGSGSGSGSGPAERLQVIPNWADMEAIRPVAAADNPLRREWGVEGKFVVCYSGNMGRAHEFHTILDAADHLMGKGVAIAFVFIGGGTQRRMVEDEVRRRGLGNVQFRPYQDRAGLSYSLGVGDAHLVSQRPEVEGYVFPSKFYGILAAGRPVVFVGDVHGEMGVLVEREAIGVAVRQGDAAGLVEQLRRLSDDPACRNAMGIRARGLLCRRYDKNFAFTSWRALLQGL